MRTSLFFLFFDISLFLFAPSTMDKTFMFLCALDAIVKFIIVIRRGDSKKYDLNKIYFRHSIVFVACFLIVFFQCDLDYIVGLAEDMDYFVYDTKVVCKAMVLSNLALSSFLVGYEYAKSKELLYRKQGTRYYPYSFKNKKILLAIALLMLAIFILFVPREYLSNGYHNNTDAGSVGFITSYLIAVLISIFVAYSASLVNSGRQDWLKSLFATLLLIIVYGGIIIATGRRTEVIRVGFMVLCSYLFITRENAKNKLILFLGAAGMLLIAIMGIYRTLVGGSAVESYVMLKDQLSIFPPTKELATSVNTLHIAMSNYPSNHFYDLGTTFFPSLFKIIPGLTGILEIITGYHFVGSDMIISKLYFSNGNIEYGLGSSVIADVYISFGIIGVIILFFVIGRFLRWLEVITFARTSSIFALALSFSCYSQFMYVCRQGVGMFFHCWGYACILLLLFIPRIKNFKRYNNEENMLDV